MIVFKTKYFSRTIADRSNMAMKGISMGAGQTIIIYRLRMLFH